MLGGKYTDMMLARQTRKNNGVQYAEMRLKSAWLGAIFFPVAISAYGWCVEKSVFIAWPLLAMFFGMYILNSKNCILGECLQLLQMQLIDWLGN